METGVDMTDSSGEKKTNLHLMSSVGQARNETATPAPAPATTCWLTVSGAPGSERSTASIWPLTVKRRALKAATVASGAPIPLYRPLGPSAASVCLTASMAPANLGGCPGGGVGWLCSFTLMVSKGCPTTSCAAPPTVPAVRIQRKKYHHTGIQILRQIR
uniref:Uncharacterized protein n=1 Tax=Oryza glumipatula TaxID=40148 RepID=A0A0E0BE40_9ORYZ